MKTKVKEIVENLETTYFIHYSCQDLSDANEGYSPRISSIAVLHATSDTMHSFSMHLVAERMKVAREEIEHQYDEIEGKMLSEFFDFVRKHQDARWVHWNMSNINFGFEALSHRYQVLTDDDVPSIPDGRRFNLGSMIVEKYGADCVDHPRMPNLMELNGKHRDVLTGAEEAEAFKDKDFVKLHKSTMSKVYWFRSMFRKLRDGKVNTQRTNWKNKVDRALESTVAKILGVLAALIAIFQVFAAVIGGFTS